MTRKKLFNPVVILVLMLVFPLSPALTEETGAKDAKSFLWRVKSPTSTVYLLGSIHFAKKELYPLNSRIEKAFERSSTLVVEVNTDAIDKDKMRKAIMLKGRYTGERTVKDSLSEEIFDMLKGFLEKNGIPMTNILKLKPGILAMTLASIQLMKLGFSPVHGVDAYFVKKAQGIKPVLELESMDEQLSLLFDMPDENLFLKYTILDLANLKQQMNDLILAWNQGDLDGMNNLIFVEPLKEHPGLLPIYQRLFFERNVKMTAKIRDLLKTKKTYFIVVGSGHLIGEKGIISLLETAQYDIRQVEGRTGAYAVNAKGKQGFGFTALHRAAFRGYKDMVEWLIALGADVNAKDKYDATPLHRAAAQKGHKDMVELLIAKGADVNAKDKQGTTPLHHAAFEGHKDMVEWLIALGADVNAKGKGGLTARHLAVHKGYGDIAEVLKRHGAER